MDGWSAGAAGLVIASLAIWATVAAGVSGGLEPNALAGIRTRATRSSPQAWQAAHQAARGWMNCASWWGLGWAVVLVVGAIAKLPDSLGPWMFGLGYVGLLVFVVIGAVVADRTARRVAASLPQP